MSSILSFPSTLGESVTKGGNHVSFEIIGKDSAIDVNKIHLYIIDNEALVVSSLTPKSFLSFELSIAEFPYNLKRKFCTCKATLC